MRRLPARDLTRGLAIDVVDAVAPSEVGVP